MAMLINREGEKKATGITWLHLFWNSLVYQTKEFFNNSTLHGVRYIAEEGRPFGERFMWFCFTASGAIAAFIIIANLWEKFQTNPTITGLDTDFHNQQVIFPTVDVCLEVPYDENRTRELAFATLGYVIFVLLCKLDFILTKFWAVRFYYFLNIFVIETTTKKLRPGWSQC